MLTPSQTNWVKFGEVSSLTFIGRDVLCYGQGCHLCFVHLITTEYTLYTANNVENGEGVRCYTGHRSAPFFAFAEKCSNPRIFVKTYPDFKTVATMLDGAPNGYLDIALTETDFMVTLSKVPFCYVTIWNWRNGDKIESVATNVTKRGQILRCNFTSPLVVAQLGCNSTKLVLWDVDVCGRKCILSPYPMKPIVKRTTFSGMAWTTEGGFFVLDNLGNVFTVNTNYSLEQVIWCEEQGDEMTSIAWYKSGFLVSGPSHNLKHYKKSGSWILNWSISPSHYATNFCSSIKDHLVCISKHGHIMQFEPQSQNFKYIKHHESKFNDFCLVYPTGEYIVSLAHRNVITCWKVSTGEKLDVMRLVSNALAMAGNPEYPYIGVSYESGVLELISVYNPEKLSTLTSFKLTNMPLQSVYFTRIGNIIVSGNLTIGEFFIIEGIPGTKMEIISRIEMKAQIADYILVASRSCLRLFAILVTSTQFITGTTFVRYCIIKDRKNAEMKYYNLEEDNHYTYSKLISTTKPNRDRIFYATPLGSKCIHEIETRRGDPVAKISNKVSSGHQLNKIVLTIDKHHIVSYAYDGLVIIRTFDTYKVIAVLMNHHRLDGGVQKAYADPLGKYVITLGRDFNLVCTSLIGNVVNEEKQTELFSLLNSIKFKMMFKRPTIGFMPTGALEGKTWLEVEFIKQTEKEREIALNERNSVLEEFYLIRDEVQELLTLNMYGPENEKLKIQEFNLDVKHKEESIFNSNEQCKATKAYLEGLIVAQDKVTAWLKGFCWDRMHVQGTNILGIFSNFFVENYSLLPPDDEKLLMLRCIEAYGQLEDLISEGDTFEPWVPKTKSELNLQAAKPPTIKDSTNLIVALEGESQEEVEEVDMETVTAFAGSISHLFIEPDPPGNPQQRIKTFFQLRFESVLSTFIMLDIKVYFNKLFDDMFNQKIREMNNVIERNARLRYILSEINYFSTNKINLFIIDPEWQQTEHPELILKVDNKEVGITPYISPSEQDILNEKAAEAERIRLALLADDFRERALMAMMNGVLEVRWEDELKKDVPLPKCMIEKQPENFNEEDLRNVRDYEEKVQFLNSERDRYCCMLESEYAKLSNTLREGIKKFNAKLSEFLLTKIKIDVAINQESLLIHRMRLMQHKRIMHMRHEEAILQFITDNDSKIDYQQTLILTLYEFLNESRAAFDNLQGKEKTLEKNFKKDFFEATPVVQEQTYKLYKKRPKTNVRTVSSITLILEVAKCTITQERTLVLNLECLEFLKAIDTLDLYVGVPNAVDENAYAIVCKHRRLRIENELKIKAVQMEIAEAESTISSFQKHVLNKKEAGTKLAAELEQTRIDALNFYHNTELQLCLRQGIVEVPTTGLISNFDDAILVSRKEIEAINNIILKGGNRKLKAMVATMNFRRGIISMEWEHQRLKMQIADLYEYLNDIEAVKVTKEIQSFLKSKFRGDPERNISFEQEVEAVKASYERMIEDRKSKTNELVVRIAAIKKDNKVLDKTIADINVDVCEYQLERDTDLEKREKDITRLRMAALLKRSKLIKQIQDNHNEILVLQTELELLRLKTFPTLKYKILS